MNGNAQGVFRVYHRHLESGVGQIAKKKKMLASQRKPWHQAHREPSCFWKNLLISLNSIVLFLAILIIILGAVAANAEVGKNCTKYDDDKITLSDEQCDEMQDNLRVFGVMIIVIGVMAILVCLAGIGGACMENKCMLFYYIVSASIFLVFTVIVFAVAGANLDDYEGKDAAIAIFVIVPVFTAAPILSAGCLMRDLMRK